MSEEYVTDFPDFDPEKVQVFECGVCEDRVEGSARELCNHGWLILFPNGGGVEARCPIHAVDIRRQIIREALNEKEVKESLS